MRTYVILAAILIAFTFTGCVVSQGSKEEFFGYSSEPRQKEVIIIKETVVENNQQPVKKQWKNPLKDESTNEYNSSDEYDSYSQYSNDNNYVEKRIYQTRYVPVIVPWWDRYYYDYWYYEPGFRISYYSGGWWGNDWSWYSPWYNYHPYHGYSWYGPHYYHHWWSDPYYYHPHYRHDHGNYSYNPNRNKSVRTFGPYRGKSITGGENNGNILNSVNSTGRSSYIPERSSSGNVPRSTGNRSTYLPSTSSPRSTGNSGNVNSPANSRSERSRYNETSGKDQNQRSGYKSPRFDEPSDNSNSRSVEKPKYTPPPSNEGRSSSGSSRSSGSSGSSGSGSSRSSYSPPSNSGSSSSGSSGRSSSSGSSSGSSKSSGSSRSTK